LNVSAFHKKGCGILGVCFEENVVPATENDKKINGGLTNPFLTVYYCYFFCFKMLM